MKPNLNKNDLRLLEYCKNNGRSISEIAKHLDIAAKNVSVRLEKLEKEDLIDIRRKGHGKKTVIRTKGSDKTKEYYSEILKELKKRGGSMSLKEFNALIPFDIDLSNPADKDKFKSILLIQYSGLVEKKVSITKEGEKFLKDSKSN